MQLVFSDQALPTRVVTSLFLAGPSPRRPDEPDWRHAAVQELAAQGYTGTVLIPVPSYRFYLSGNWAEEAKSWDYDDQISWECRARQMADLIVFWVPRVIDRTQADLGMPAFTTNFELGEDLHSGKVVYGRPATAEKCKYLDLRVRELGYPVHETLASLFEDCRTLLGVGALRTNGEVTVPLFIWNTESFQSWYGHVKAAGNRLVDAQLLNIVAFAGRHLFAYTLKVNIWVESERRHKSNECFIARKDISAVVATYRDESVTPAVTHIALVREFRSPANNPEGFVYELPAGSSPAPGVDPAVNAQHEFQEELGLRISDLTRFKPVGTRQLAATLSIHRAQVYALALTASEFSLLQSFAESHTVFGVQREGERTYVALTTRERLFDKPLDYATLGMVFEALERTAPATLTLRRPDEETLAIELNGQPLVQTNHDSHGWEGMALAETLASVFARAFNLTIEHT